MKVALSCALALLVADLSHLAPPTPASHCAAPADHDAVRAKPSSFAPHRSAQNRVYGAPIQPRIFKSRPKKKDPELKSTALPEA